MLNIIILTVLIIALIITIVYGIFILRYSKLSTRAYTVMFSYDSRLTLKDISSIERDLTRLIPLMDKAEFIEWLFEKRSRQILFKICYHRAALNPNGAFGTYLKSLYNYNGNAKLFNNLEVFDDSLYNEQIPDDKLFELIQVAYGEGKIGK